MDPPATKPGYKVCSSSFIVEFVAAQQIELEGNWHRMMIFLVNAFEMWPRNMARIEREAKLVPDFDFRVERVKITISTCYRIKRVHVHLKDITSDIKSILIFYVKKKQEMKKLQTLAAETISDCVSRKEDFEHPEIPKHLLVDLIEVYHDIWRGNIHFNMKCKNCSVRIDTQFIQCPSNITHKFCFPCARNYIINYSSSEVFCPSGERCPLQGHTLPWLFMEENIESILGYHPDKEKEKK